MNLFGLSPGELILIALVAMIVLGPEKLPETAASVGKWIREFRRVTQELTQQFADENPFTEIQRALAFNDEPQVVAAVPEPAPIETSNADFNVGHASADVHAGGVSSNGLIARPPRRSDYFDHPSYYTAIEDSWTHSGLDGYRPRNSGHESLVLPIADDWVHGVPVPLTHVEIPSPVSSEDIAVLDHQSLDVSEPGLVASAELVRAGVDGIEASPGAVNSVSAELTGEVVAEPSEVVVTPIEELPSSNTHPLDSSLADDPVVESNGHVQSDGLNVLHPPSSSEPDRESPVAAGAGHAEEHKP